MFGTKSAPPEEVTANPKVAHHYEVPKPAKREPGSLWSEDSRWNAVYSSGSSRMVGDPITLKVNEPFKERISMAMNQNRRIEPAKGASDNKNESKNESREPASTNQAMAKKDDTATVEATILEVLPNGAYRVGVNRAFKIGREQPYVVLEGVVKEREISSDDSASTDALMNLKLETFDEQKHSIQSESKKDEKK
jgi:flagellar basal body L-ring protein FlgH